MRKAVTKAFLAMMFMAAPFLHAQSYNQVWFTMWNAQPFQNGDTGVQMISTNGSGSLISPGTAVSYLNITNFQSFNTPYDIAVDPAMGKVFVLDNNSTGSGAQEYIYSCNIVGTPAQIAASAQVIYTMPTTLADTNANYYGYLGGIALDPTNHYLYFDQLDVNSSTNSYVGRLALATSAESDVFSSVTNVAPTLQTLYTGQIPGFGPIAIDVSNVYLGNYNTQTGTNGVFAAPISGVGNFSEVIAITTNDLTFSNGFISGIASYSQGHLIYYLTMDVHSSGINNGFSTAQNAFWQYNTQTHVKTLIASGYPGLPDNIALDVPNNRYYFTTGRDGTGNPSPTNYQAIYTGTLNSTSGPTLYYAPPLTGLDTNSFPGNVSVQGIYVVDTGVNPQAPITTPVYVTAVANASLYLAFSNVTAYDSDPNGYQFYVSSVNASTNGASTSTYENFIIYTPVTNFTGTDQFTYTVANTHTAQSQGVINVRVVALPSPPTNHLSVSVVSTGPLILFSGAPNQYGVLEYANSPLGPWTILSESIPGGPSGLIQYNDLTSPLPPARFYLLRVF